MQCSAIIQEHRASLIVDSSPGCDAAAGLVWAATAPDVELVAAIGTWGNVSSGQATRNVLSVLEAAGSTAPVFAGEPSPLGPAPPGAPATMVYGEDGLGDVGVPDPSREAEAEEGAEAVVRLARERPGELTLVCCCPMSTVARALALDPGLPGRLAGMFVMAGAVAGGGNMTAAAEANVAHDPQAAGRVIDAFGAPGALASGDPPHMVPLDVTLEAGLTEAEREMFPSSSVGGVPFLHPIISAPWERGHLETRGRCWPAHDLLTPFTVVHPEVLRWELLPVAVDTAGGAAWGSTVVDRRLRLMKEAGFEGGELEAMAAAIGMVSTRWAVATAADGVGFRTGVRAWIGATESSVTR